MQEPQSTSLQQWIVFDLFGVLASSGIDDAIGPLSRKLNTKPEFLLHVYRSYEPAFDCGEIDEESFWRHILSDIKVTAKWQDLNEIVLSSYYLLAQGVELLGAVRSRTSNVALLTNTRTPWLEHLDQKWGLLESFKKIFNSYELGLRKPEPEIFLCVQDKLNVPPGEIIFLDDTSENITAARNHGWKAIHYEFAAAAYDRLGKLAPGLAASYSWS